MYLLNYIFSAEMMGFQVFDPATNYYPHNLTITSKNITLQSLAYLQRGNFSLSAFQDSVFEPPPLILYTKFSSEIYFLAFWGIMLIQCLTICITDKLVVRNIPDNVTLWERIMHAIVKSQFPFPFVNWHEAFGDCKDHKKRQKDAQHEVFVTTAVNLIFNILLLVPLVILCKYYCYKVTIVVHNSVCKFGTNTVES